VKFTYDINNLSHTFNLPATDPQEEAPVEKLGENVTVTNVIANSEGIELHLTGSEGKLDFRFHPEAGWDDFLTQSGCSQNATGTGACDQRVVAPLTDGFIGDNDSSFRQ
jgi:hypothetical protein